MKKKSTSGQRRDASTSRRLNVVMSQRRDVAASRRQRDFSITIIKSKKGPEFEDIEGRTNKGTESRAAATQINEEETCFCIFFFYDKLADVL